MLTNSELILGAAGIGVLGSAVGAVITWRASLSSAVGAANAQRQLEADRRRADQRAQLYQDMLMRAARLVRLQRQSNLIAPPPEPAPGEILDNDRWQSRVALFASPEVSKLWNGWFTVHTEGWLIHRTGLESETDRKRYADQTKRRETARGDLVDQMRNELEAWSD